MKTILTIVGYYLPGYKGGGPTRSVANLIAWLGDDYRFDVLTRDRDLGDRLPYPNITLNLWQTVGKARVLYLSPERLRLPTWYHQLRSLDYDVLFLNSFFDILSVQTLALRKMGLLGWRPLLLAPRGEFSPGALALKHRKKSAYLRLASTLDLCHDAIWLATSDLEVQDIRRTLGAYRHDPVILVAPNLVDIALSEITMMRSFPKRPGHLRVVFLSRVARKKNLAGALRYLAGVRGEITLDIYGPIEDSAYWQECQVLIAQLPSAIQVRQHGEVSHDQVPAIMAQHDLFLLPTLGENFGHAIQEALLSGCPVLISDRTPWRNLEGAQAGFDVSLEQPQCWREALQFFVDMDEPTHRQWRTGARAYGAQTATSPEAIEQNRRLFATVAALAEKARHEARRT